MKLTTMHSDAADFRSKGNWKPLFKSRFIRYRQEITDPDYESKLRQNLFYLGDIVVSKNAYPFNLGPGLQQMIIWIRNPESDPGIDKLTELISKLYPGLDYQILINTMENRTIKSIIHYHAIIKEITPKLELKKLIIFFRHGNRFPISKIPKLEQLLLDPMYADEYNADLIGIGMDNAENFGRDLADVYKLDSKDFVNSIYVTSSPIKRCIDTALFVCHGLNLISHKLPIVKNKNLIVHIHKNLNQIRSLNTDEWIKLELKYRTLLNEFCEKVGAKPSNPSLLTIYDYYSSLIAYKDLGIDINYHIDPYIKNDLVKRIETAGIEIFNFIVDKYQIAYAPVIKRIIQGVFSDSGDSKLILSATHDTTILAIVKYLMKINKIDHNFEIPGYLSNVRLEEWSDGTRRIYYNNWYLGDKYLP